MIFNDLTQEQRRLADHPDEAFTGACPGAGKTRTILERVHVISQTRPPRKGVAVLSFTNTAVDEFLDRCRQVGAHRLAEFPGYVGTFDAFLRHFIVMPGGVPGYSGRPTVVDSWDTLGVEIRLAGARAFRGAGVSLDAFDPTTGHLELSRIGDTRLRQHATHHAQAYEQAARARRRGLFQAGYLSAADVRDVAVARIRDAIVGPALGAALAGRFVEVIVDEAQDCNPLDLEVVRWLRAQCLRVSLVHDIDQAIYGFRQGQPTELAQLGNQYHAANRLPLTGNFRSSSAICALASTLRPDQRIDEPLGRYKDVEVPVLLLGYRGASISLEIGASFTAQLERFEIPTERSIVLAHARRTARVAAGIPTERDVGSSRTERIAEAIGQFWSPASGARGREAALTSIEALLLDFAGLRQAGEPPSRTVARLALDARLLRRQALAIASNSPPTCEDSDHGRGEWLTALRGEIDALGIQPASGVSTRSFFRAPPRGSWSRHLEGHAASDSALRYATVHEAKGREYEAVCLVIPPNRGPENRTNALLDAWETRTDSEPKRVIYVGATRAMQFLCLAVPQNAIDRIRQVLENGQVLHEVVEG